VIAYTEIKFGERRRRAVTFLSCEATVVMTEQARIGVIRRTVSIAN
jgi:hypothetical protein